MNLKTTPLRDFVEVNSEGITKAYPYDEILYIDISSVVSGHFVETPKLLSLNEAPSRAKRIVRDGDTILATVRPNLRSFLFIREPETNTIASTGFAVLRAKENADPRFIYYAVTDRRFTGYLTNNTKGTSYPAVDTDTVLRGEIPDFNLHRQQAIASILSTYDDLIENNRRRIQLLERAARLLYREWFVYLRFPGHEHVTITDGVPDGWEKKSLTDFADSVSYGLTASSTQEEIGPKFLRITDIVPSILDWEEVPFCEATENEIDRNRLEVGDVVVARTGATVGYAKLISHLVSEAVYASYLVRFRFHTPTNSLIAGIFMESDSYKEHVRNHAGGAAQPNANAKVLGLAILLIPPQVLQEQFSVSVTPVLNQRDALVRQNTRLTQARNLLLPRLMNEEVAV